MRELFCEIIMFIPEYTITNKILQNIASIEYVRAIAEHSVILNSWEKRQQKEAEVKFIRKNLNLEGIKIGEDEIRSFVDGITPFPAGIVQGIKKGLDITQNNSFSYELDEKDIIDLFYALSGMDIKKAQIYRNKKLPVFSSDTQKTNPEEILSQMTELLDWINGLDGRETHPLIKASIIKGKIMTMLPFSQYNEVISNLLAYRFLKNGKYTIKDFCHLEMAYTEDPLGYEDALESILTEEDMTTWINFFTGAMALEAIKKREEILLLSKDTKISQASGNADLTGRQERIVEYLQDYGKIQNKDFGTIFPNISEDSVLRDLKVLMDEDVIVKKGKTKSSRYELK
jgi:Fic family protein